MRKHVLLEFVNICLAEYLSLIFLLKKYKQKTKSENSPAVCKPRQQCRPVYIVCVKDTIWLSWNEITRLNQGHRTSRSWLPLAWGAVPLGEISVSLECGLGLHPGSCAAKGWGQHSGSCLMWFSFQDPWWETLVQCVWRSDLLCFVCCIKTEANSLSLHSAKLFGILCSYKEMCSPAWLMLFLTKYRLITHTRILAWDSKE